MARQISSPFPIFTDVDGSPLEDGYIFIGAPDVDPVANPKNAYWDEGLTSLATQPVRTKGGYPYNGSFPDRLYVDGDYSILIRNKRNLEVYSSVTAPKDVQAQIDALDGRVTVNEGDITSIEGGVSALDGRVTTNEGDISTLEEVSAVATEYDLTATDVLFTLPVLTGAPQEREVFWSNGGTHKIQFQDDDLNVSEYEGEGEGHIKFVSTGTAWKVAEYEDSGVIPDSTNAFEMSWRKNIDGTIEEWAEMQDPSPSWSSGGGKYYANYIATIPKELYTTDKAVCTATPQDGQISARGAWIIKSGVQSTTTLEVWFGATAAGTAALVFSIYLKGRWKA